MNAGAADPMIDDDGPDPDENGPARRCIVTGDILPKEALMRFAIAPSGEVVPDVAERLPGRGLWVSATREAIETAAAKNLFARAARRQAKAPANLAAQTAALLRQRLIDMIGIARRAGQAVCGFEKVEAQARRNATTALLIASDSGKDGRGKLEALAQSAHIIDVLDSRTLAGIFGTIGIVVYAGISDKAHAARLISLAEKLKALT